MKKKLPLIIFLLPLWLSAWALDAPKITPIDNLEVKSLYNADQEDRKAVFRPSASGPSKKNADTIWANDAARIKKVRLLIQKNSLRTAADYWRAAFIMQHGTEMEDFRLAFSLATLATELAPENKQYKWIAAAAWDRILVRKKQPQWYGTQFAADPASGKQVQAPLAENAIDDAERQQMGVPTLKESEEMLKEINASKHGQ